MILITSAAHVQGDLRSEFGPIPPALLPLGNRSLIHWQATLLREHFADEEIVLSLPEGETLNAMQSSLIDAHKITVVSVPDGFSLASSVLYVLNVVKNRDDVVRILHGDTLLSTLSAETDIIGVAMSDEPYDWQLADSVGEFADTVWCGYFAFSHRLELVRALAMNSDSFVDALKAYSAVKSLREVEAVGWLDLGHLNTYLRAREQFTTERSFNSLTISDGVVYKGGDKHAKLSEEANWFSGLPFEFKRYAPCLYSADPNTGEYALEYLPNVPLNELFVHGALPLVFWRSIFKLTRQWLIKALAVGTQIGDHSRALAEHRRIQLVGDKTRSRLLEFAHQKGIDLDRPLMLNGRRLSSINKIVEDLIVRATDVPTLPGLLHGDLCFSNVLYDSRNRNIRVLDPRGVATPELERYIGDLSYDIAKFAHSVVGFYDIIIAGGFDVEVNVETMDFSLKVYASGAHERIRDAFLAELDIGSFVGSSEQCLPQMILLFLSMAPLHGDVPARQWALFLNGLALYLEIYGGQ